MTSSWRFEGTLAVIGGGKMGEAIVSGLLAAGAVDASRVAVAEPSAVRRGELAPLGVRVVSDGSDALAGADVVILAVKPQIISAVVAELSEALAPALVISIAAGISCARLESELPAGTAVVRVMPNTPAMVGAGMAVVSGGTEADADQVELARSLFAAIGRSIVVEERYQDAATAISGSGPAYFALVVDALARGGVAQGLSRAVAEELAIQTMFGTATLLARSGQHPEALIDAVASPGGTTIAALGELERRGVRSAFADAVAVAVRRSKELGA